jgi:hypothetical protein
VTTDLKRTAGVFIETAWAGAAYYLLWFMLAGHVSASSTIISVLMFPCLLLNRNPSSSLVYSEISIICKISTEVLPLSK